MPFAEILAGLGLAASEIFRYNRENFEFDQDQRFEREELRLKMQVERFALFREDIRDLVELTVGKMDLYHFVCALFLKAVILYYAKGQFEQPPPTFLLALYYVSNACALVYLLLAIWMAMHASIACTSYGVRLLTRFVRLPIPGSQQLNVLNARMADFERQGASAMMRIPFVDKRHNDWMQRGRGADQLVRDRAEDTLAAAQGMPTNQLTLGPGETDLDQGQQAFENAGELLKAVELRTFRHVQLFRQLQAQWQCYDAYARVCLALGVRQMLQAANYFAIGFTMVDNCEPMAAVVLTITIQAIAATLSVLDIHGLPCYGSFDLQVVGGLPALLTCATLILARRTPGLCTAVGEEPHDCPSEGVCHKNCILDPNNKYLLSLASLALEVCWFELLIWVASPSRDEASLPRHFRTVLFMDVFGDVDDPTEIDFHTGEKKLSGVQLMVAQECADAAGMARAAAEAALGRWVAARNTDPRMLSQQQGDTLEKARKDLKRWSSELSQCCKRHRLERTRGNDEEDPRAIVVVGPFERRPGGSTYYYRAEAQKFVYDIPTGCKLLTLGELEEDVRVLRKQTQQLINLYGVRYDKPGKSSQQDSDSDSEKEEGLDPRSPSIAYTTNGNGRSYVADDSRSPISPRSDARSTQVGAGDQETIEVTVHPVRLPWKVMRTLTRAIQLVWLLVSLVASMQEFNIASLDVTELRPADEDRRLLAVGQAPSCDSALQQARWRFEELNVSWPHASFFRAETLSCLQDDAGGALALVGSAFAAYGLSPPRGGGGAMQLEEVRTGNMPPSAVAFCPPAGADRGPSCLLGAPEAGGVMLAHIWSNGSAGGAPPQPQLLRVDGPRWARLGGAMAPCSMVPRPNMAPTLPSGDCLVMAGWSGDDKLRLVAAPLSTFGAAPGTLEAAGPPVSLAELSLELSLEQAAPRRLQRGKPASPTSQESRCDVRSLHLEATGMRLWALTGSGDLLAWDLHSGGRAPRPVAMELPAAGRLRAGGLCEEAGGSLLLVASVSTGGGAQRPVLLRAARPPDCAKA